MLTQLGNQFGSCFISVNVKTHNFLVLDDPKTTSRMKRNYILVWVWAFASLALVGKYYITGMTERYNITLFFWMVGITATIVYSVLRWFTRDLIIAANSTVVLFQHLQSKQTKKDVCP